MTARAGDAVVVPGAPVLQSRYASLHDPVAPMRAAALEAVAWLVERHPDRLVVLAAGLTDGDRDRGVTRPAGLRVATDLLAVTGFTGRIDEHVPASPPVDLAGAGLLVVADGSASRRPDAPGGFDRRAAAFDATVEQALRAGDPDGLRGLDGELGRAVLCSGVPALRALGALCAPGAPPVEARVDYADDPFGVQYWVVRWQVRARS